MGDTCLLLWFSFLFFRENKETQELNVLPMSIKWAGCLHSSFDKSGGETVLNYWMGDLSPSPPWMKLLSTCDPHCYYQYHESPSRLWMLEGSLKVYRLLGYNLCSICIYIQYIWKQMLIFTSDEWSGTENLDKYTTLLWRVYTTHLQLTWDHFSRISPYRS